MSAKKLRAVLTGLLVACLLLPPGIALANDADLLRTTFAKHGAVMLFIAPENGRIIDANDAAARFYGYSLDKLRTMRIQDINVIGADEVAAERARAKSENRNYFIFPHRLASGEIRTVEVYSWPIALADKGNVLFSIVHDISGKRIAEAALLEHDQKLATLVDQRTREASEADGLVNRLLVGGFLLTLVLNALLFINIRRKQAALAALARESTHCQALATDMQCFAEITAHHLQEPARRMASYADRLGMQLAGKIDDAETQRSLDFISQQARRQQNLLRDVELYLAAGQPRGEVRRVDVGALVARALERLKPAIDAAGAQITVGDLPPAWMDAARLANLFEVALDNALRHGGSSALVPLQITLSGEHTGPKVRYCISDNGPGIEAEYRERVFRVFERLAPSGDGDGTGIGLAIVRRITESGGGQAWIDEPPGGGCRLQFELPAENTP
jgi:chemotaxis family two-component system sensor kinase Cph1